MKMLNANIIVASVLVLNLSLVSLKDVCNVDKFQTMHFDISNCSKTHRFSNKNSLNDAEKNIKISSMKYERVDIFELWRTFPPTFVPMVNTSEKCEADVKHLMAEAKALKLWALKMLDSSAKLPSGILNGNINQYGDFDQCLSINRPILGKYCLATIDVSFKIDYELDSLIHSHHWVASNATDPGHRMPRVSTIQWGVCLPDSCSAQELEISLKIFFKSANNVIVNEKLCKTTKDDRNPMSFGKIFTTLFFLSLLCCIIFGTILDNGDDKKYSNISNLLIRFSLKRNIKKFLDTSSTSEDILALDGIRALNALGLLLSHKTFALFFNPYINKTYMAEMFGKPWAIIGRTAILYTDAFLLISGLLTANSLLKDLQLHNEMRFFTKFVNRLFRLVPGLLTVILFCTYILPDLGDGPQWELVINEHSKLCKMNMWKNFLFIHNLLNFENMCLTHTHQLGIDMQLFLMSPIAVGLLWYFKRKGVQILLSVALLSTFLRFIIVKSKGLSLIVYCGISVEQLFNTANYSYIIPTHRATIYIMGILLAYFLKQKQNRIYISKFYACLGWILTTILGLLTLIGPWHIATLEYKYNNVEAAFYGALSPITWGIFVSWFIWACNNNCGGLLNVFFSSKPLKLFTKIAYGVYLTQFPIFFYNIGIQRNADYYRMHMMINILELCAILFSSIILTVFVDIPFNNIYMLLFKK